MRSRLDSLLSLMRGNPRLAKGLTGSLGLKLVNAVLALIVSVLLGRQLGPEGYGVYAFAMSVLAILAIPVQLGIPTLMVREVAKFRKIEDWARLHGIIRFGWLTIAAASALVVVVGGALLWAGVWRSPESTPTLWLALLLVPVMGLSQARQAVLQGFRLSVWGQMPELLIIPASVACMLLLWPDSQPLTPTLAMIMQCVAAAISFVAGGALLRHFWPADVLQAPRIYELAAWSRTVLPFSLLQGFRVAKRQSDIFILGLVAASSEVGMYRVAVAISSVVVFGLSAFNVVLAPRVAALHAAGDIQRLQRLVTVTTRIVFAGALPAMILVIGWGDRIVDVLYGAEYARAVTPVLILCVAQFVSAAAGSVVLLLNMSGFEMVTLRTSVIMTSLSVVLLILLAPRWGAAGAATASALTTVGWNIVLLLFVRKYVGVEPGIIGFGNLGKTRKGA